MWAKQKKCKILESYAWVLFLICSHFVCFLFFSTIQVFEHFLKRLFVLFGSCWCPIYGSVLIFFRQKVVELFRYFCIAANWICFLGETKQTSTHMHKVMKTHWNFHCGGTFPTKGKRKKNILDTKSTKQNKLKHTISCLILVSFKFLDVEFILITDILSPKRMKQQNEIH